MKNTQPSIADLQQQAEKMSGETSITQPSLRAQVSLEQLTSDVARLHAVQIIASMEVKRTFWRCAPAFVWACLIGAACLLSQMRG